MSTRAVTSAPGDIEATYSGFLLRDIRIKGGYITGSITLDDFRREAFPRHGFTPTLFPGLF